MSPSRVMTLGRAARKRYQVFESNMNLPDGCSFINAVQYKIIKTRRVPKSIKLLVDNIGISAVTSARSDNDRDGPW